MPEKRALSPRMETAPGDRASPELQSQQAPVWAQAAPGHTGHPGLSCCHVLLPFQLAGCPPAPSMAPTGKGLSRNLSWGWSRCIRDPDGRPEGRGGGGCCMGVGEEGRTARTDVPQLPSVLGVPQTPPGPCPTPTPTQNTPAAVGSQQNGTESADLREWEAQALGRVPDSSCPISRPNRLPASDL